MPDARIGAAVRRYTPQTLMNEDGTITVADGRTVGYSSFGDVDGAPVILFHGTPGSRVIGRIWDGLANDIGCHLIATDRPGYGLSSFQEGRTLSDHTQDVVAICDELGIDRFAVAGVSGGTPYVFACASQLPERVTAGAVVSGFYGLDGPVDSSELPELVRTQFEQIREDPELSRANFDGATAMIGAADPQTIMLQITAESPEWVRSLVESDPLIGEVYVEHHREAMRPGTDGGVHEMGLNTRPWGIDFSSVGQEIRLWHGGKDPVPRSHIDAVAAALPKSKVSWHEDCGHVDCALLMPDILRWLITTQ